MHAADLRQGDMRLVDEHQVIVREEVDQRFGGGARNAAREMAGIILDAGAVAGLADHFEVVVRLAFEAVGFGNLSGGTKLVEAFGQFGFDGDDGGLELRFGRHVMLGREDADALQGFALAVIEIHEPIRFLIRTDVEDTNVVDRVAEEIEADDGFAGGEMDVDAVAADAELAAVKGLVVAFVLDADEAAQYLVALDDLAGRKALAQGEVIDFFSEAVDAGNGGDDQDVAAVDERLRRGVAETVDLLVDRRFLFDIGIGLRDIGFRLVVVVVGDEVMDGRIREELLEFPVELGGEGLVMRNDERRLVELRDDIGHRERLARAGDAEQCLLVKAGFESVDQFLDRVRLVAGRLEGGVEDKH